ncbi:MAG: hypothetical protein ACF8TS_20090 [Maioricimonas sp. JB049]
MHENHTQESKWQGLVEAAKQLNWRLVFTGITVGVLGMQVLIVRPLSSQIEAIHHEMVELQEGMKELAGSRNDVWQTNDLLTALELQREKFAETGQAVEAIRALRQEIEVEAARTREAMAAVRGMAELQDGVMTVHSGQAKAMDAIGEIASVNRELISVTASADEQLAGLETLRGSLRELSLVKEDLIAQGGDVDAARASLDDLAGLKTQVLESGLEVEKAHASLAGLANLKNQVTDASADVEAVAASADQLIGLKDQIVAGAKDTELARQNAGELLALHDSLIDEEHLNIADADRNLEGLLTLQADLAGRGDQIGRSIQTLELLNDFQVAFSEQIGQLDGMRRELTELILMQNTIARTVRTLRPLADLGNLRRLGDDEVREAARVILDRRTGRIGANDLPAEALLEEPVESNATGRLVPTPPADVAVE